ncbi:acyl-CoA thioesterase-1 [Monaibacterium marinum]|uniref:Acyl-CoA thioesterase-1 n=1 Tax=Pontivivens marinum TaxID=1690039 RepID=A0A2C9CM76_9RHOB|nr:arylesterase [Monaibacterium marinum]SOH92317.1 acyl-CoA thioesterase-1 [Monaibacterium marinum]
MACGITTAASADTITVAALGDSLTQGYGLPPQDGLVPQMQTWLDQQGEDVSLLNAGVSGDTTAGGLARIDWTLSPDVDALIVALGGNDVLRGIDPANSLANLDGIMARAAAADIPVLLIGMQAPGNFGPDYKQSFDAIYPDLAQQYDALLVDDFFAGIGVSDLSAARDLMQADGIHPNAQGVAQIVAALGPRVQELIAVAGE